MPTYDYTCPTCGDFDALRRMDDRNEPCACPTCGQNAERVMLNAPRLTSMTPQARLAADVNDRSRHAPRSSRDPDAGGYGRLRHPKGCGCCTPSAKAKSAAPANAVKSQVGKRPWMISH